MKKFLLSLCVLLSLSAPALALEQPTYRTAASATGKNASVSLAVEAGDVVIVYVASNSHTLGELSSGSASDSSGSYWNYGNTVWKMASGKYAMVKTFIRPQPIATAGTLAISTDTSGSSAAVVIAVAVSGMTVVDLSPDVLGHGDHTVRQQKSNAQDIGSPDAPIMPGATPVVPLSGQTAAYLSTSLELAVFANESNPNGVTAPSGWTQGAEAHVTAGGKSLSISVVYTTGVTAYQTTWGSTTATRGNCSSVEIQPLQ